MRRTPIAATVGQRDRQQTADGPGDPGARLGPLGEDSAQPGLRGLGPGMVGGAWAGG